MPAPATTAAPAIPAPNTQPSVSGVSSGVFLQFGAFASQKNAESYLGRLQTQVDASVATTLQVHPQNGLFRVQAGPYASKEEARRAAEQLSQALGLKTVVVTR